MATAGAPDSCARAPAAKLSGGYRFRYRYYGPYSENLSEDLRRAWAQDLVDEEEKRADWGGTYSIYRLGEGVPQSEPASDEGDDAKRARTEFLEEAVQTNAVLLELAATAAFLKVEEQCDDPWGEVKKLKPDKATDTHIAEAKKAYAELRKKGIGRELPAFD